MVEFGALVYNLCATPSQNCTALRHVCTAQCVIRSRPPRSTAGACVAVAPGVELDTADGFLTPLANVGGGTNYIMNFN